LIENRFRNLEVAAFISRADVIGSAGSSFFERQQDRPTVVVDINPSAVAKLTDQQTFQALGLVTDIEPFLRELVHCLEQLRTEPK